MTGSEPTDGSDSQGDSASAAVSASGLSRSMGSLGGPVAAKTQVNLQHIRDGLIRPPHARSGRRGAMALLIAVEVAAWCVAIGVLELAHLDRAADPLWIGVVIAGSVAATTFLSGGYSVGLRSRRSRLRNVAFAIPAGALLGWVVLKFSATKLRVRSLSPPDSLGLLGVASALTLAAIVARWLLARRQARVLEESAVVFVGADAAFERFSARMAALGLVSPLGHVALTTSGGSGPAQGQGLVGLTEATSGPVRALVLGVPIDRLAPASVGRLLHCAIRGIPLMSRGQFQEELWEFSPIDEVDEGWFVNDTSLQRRSSFYLASKRLIDLFGAALGLVIAWPVMLVVALVIKLESKGPIIFAQTRTGRWKTPFTMYKFRTMARDAEAKTGAVWSQDADPRITRVGRLLRRSRLDELPQLVNVLLGQMSLVGPRPERPEFNEALAARLPYYDLRHLVKPGLTGWAQVRRGYGASLSDSHRKMELDLYYVKRASMALDVRIMWLTLPVVLGLKGR